MWGFLYFLYLLMYIQLLLIGDSNGSRTNMARSCPSLNPHHLGYMTMTQNSNQKPTSCNLVCKKIGIPNYRYRTTRHAVLFCLESLYQNIVHKSTNSTFGDNLLHLKGQSTSSNFTHKRVKSTLSENIFISEEYGQEALVGGSLEVKEQQSSQFSSQTYDLNALVSEVSESWKAIEVKRFIMKPDQQFTRYFDPYFNRFGTYNMLDGFGFGSYSPDYFRITTDLCRLIKNTSH